MRQGPLREAIRLLPISLLLSGLPPKLEALCSQDKNAGDERADCGCQDGAIAVDDAKGRPNERAGEECGTIERVEHVSCYL